MIQLLPVKIDDIRNHFEARPFRPFTIRIADGRSVRVDHPEFMAVSSEDETFVVHEPGGGWRIIDSDAVTELTVGTKSPRNGKKRR